MHEFSIAEALVTAAEGEARRVGAIRITRLHCRIGALRQVDGDLLREAFELARDGTVCSTAELTVERTHLQADCPACHTSFPIIDWQWNCPTCGGRGENAAGGDELELISLEAEVPDEG